ncbi:MAG: hypothetical protein RJR37_08975 [Peptococcaceae bacterium MAG4]|jgi:hypothetical protein|nr:hypothetical protein [Peptococcaceae bacterium MAG4]
MAGRCNKASSVVSKAATEAVEETVSIQDTITGDIGHEDNLIYTADGLYL